MTRAGPVWIWSAVRFGAMVTALGFLLHTVLSHRAAPLPPLLNLKLLCGVAASFGAFALFTARFRYALCVAGLAPSYRESLRVNALGAFLDFVLPISGGGDTAKYLKFRAASDKHLPLAPAAGIALDHALGFIAALFLMLALLHGLPGPQWSLPLAWLLCVGGALLAIGFYVYRRWAVLIQQWSARLWHQRRLAVFALVSSILMQNFLALALWLGARAWSIDVDFQVILWALAASALSSVVPVKLAGLGAREVTLVGLLTLLGVTPTDALLLGTLLYGYKALIAVCGGITELVTPVTVVGAR